MGEGCRGRIETQGKVFFGTGNHSGGMCPDQETAGQSEHQQ